MSAIRVIIVDDQELLRRGLRMILETDPVIDVVGEAENGMRALALIPHLAPDVVLADARMPVLDGLGLVQQCTVSHPGLPVLVLTTFDDARLVHQLLNAGAAGFLLKDISTEALTDAIRQVLAGGLVLDPRVARAALSFGSSADRQPALTDAEQAVADLVARGLPNAEIATRLHLAHGTVKNTVSALLRKLDEPDRTALALRLARGLAI
ncbi:response regulator transcription factor [Klugiella xanthotipulae]|uniref:LuxR family two component transcriptional regulator n=1 Tax=Klugiella xanthotipulae TaxID=244735 RepID=A0A543I6M8_9MICO|nr:response regulator transcription factor [Klugiella xanthotipulae]TQM66262.1 LuxR family two component transcriptional regulator [Klugiella xanthotipulae]